MDGLFCDCRTRISLCEYAMSIQMDVQFLSLSMHNVLAIGTVLITKNCSFLVRYLLACELTCPREAHNSLWNNGLVDLVKFVPCLHVDPVTLRTTVLLAGEPAEIKFDIGWTSMTFNKGHRIRVLISSTGCEYNTSKFLQPCRQVVRCSRRLGWLVFYSVV